MRILCEREGSKLLGSSERLEQLVNWSITKPKGTRFQKDFPIGLLLIGIANAEEPMILVHWNETKFRKCIFGTKTAHFNCHGFTVKYHKEKTIIKVLTAGQGPIIWQSGETIPVVSQLIGGIQLKETGIYWMNEREAISLALPSRPAKIINKPSAVAANLQQLLQR